MKRVLIISHHFPPDNIVASRRVEAYCRYLHEFGIFPTVVTTRFEKKYFNKEKDLWQIKYHNRDEDPVFEKFKHYEVFHLPRPIVRNPFRRIPFFRTLIDIFGYVRGHFRREDRVLRYVYRKFLDNHLSTANYDLILGIYSPVIGPQMAFEFGNKFNTPFAIDFRDLWDNRELDPNYKPTFSRKNRNVWMKRFFKKWLNDSLFFTITSLPWLEEIQKLTSSSGYVIQNGYFDLNTQNNHSNKKFTISSVGTIYPQQDITIFFEAISQLHKSHPELEISIQIVGLKEHNYAGITELMELRLPSDWTHIQPWVEKEQALTIINQSDLLYYPAQSIPGWVSAKVYEYIASGNNILVCPGDNNVCDELITSTGSGTICNTSQEAKNFILKSYNEWVESGHCISLRKQEEVEKYSRKNQVKLFSQIVDSKINLSE